MTGHGEKFSRQQERALAALILHRTISAAAVACEISESTLRRWLQNADFAAQYEKEKRGLVQTATTFLRQHLIAAMVVVVDIMGDDQAPPGARLAAARSVIELSLRLPSGESESREQKPMNAGFEARIALLEKAFSTPLILLRSDGTTRRLNNTDADVCPAMPQLTADAE